MAKVSPVPILPEAEAAALSAEDHARLAQIADQLVADEPALTSSLGFGPHVRQGIGPGPSVLIGDQGEIPLFQPQKVSWLDHRMALLSNPEDVVIVRSRDRDFESYLAGTLGLRDLRFLAPSMRTGDPVCVQALSWSALGDQLELTASRRDTLTLQSYLTTGHVWRLARHLGEKTGTRAYVAGPSPRLSRRANDKLWFTRLAQNVLGPGATPPTLTAYGPAAAAGLVAFFSKKAENVVVKVPDSAGSAGNLKFLSASLQGRTLRDIRAFLTTCLRARGWQGRYPILIGVWDKAVTHSPSVQFWIPRAKSGPPLSEGVFEQQVYGAEGTFVGGARSALPAQMQHRLIHEATKIATVFQQIGYFGRCSMDAVICNGADGRPTVHWIECNARWGGMSIPMSVAKRFYDGTLPAGFLVVQQEYPDAPALSTRKALSRLDGLLFRADGPREGLILLSPPRGNQGVFVNLLALAGSQTKARSLITQATERLAPRR
ncbi:MAG: hypothetical protein JXR14_01225 [Paracoccaceae bacterium]